MKLQDKIIIVTGANSGIGKAITKIFLEEGGIIAAVDVRDNDLTELKNDPKFKEKLITYIGDVSNRQDMEKIVDDVVKNNGRLDIVVNNAGIMDEMMPVGEVTDELWNKVLEVNLNGPMFLSRKALEVMLPQEKGNIINICSIGGLFGSRAGAAYTASKFALVGLTKNMGYMYANKGIRCNGISPGAVSTNIGLSIKNPSPLGMDRAMSGIATNPRQGEPEEIAKVALFLASDDSSFINGAIITADAGWTAY